MPIRYVVQCTHCKARTGTNPIGMEEPAIPGEDRVPEPETVPCVQCGLPVSRRNGEYLREPQRNNQQEEPDLLSME